MSFTEEDAIAAYAFLSNIDQELTGSDTGLIDKVIAAVEGFVLFYSNEFGVLNTCDHKIEMTQLPEGSYRNRHTQSRKLKGDYVKCLHDYKTLAMAIDETQPQIKVKKAVASLGLSLVRMIMSINEIDSHFDDKFLIGFQSALKKGLQVKKSLSKRATDSKYKPLRDFKAEAARIVEDKWNTGSTLNHAAMRDWLIKDYVDENGRHPFGFLPTKPKDGDPIGAEKVLLEVTKSVAKAIRRPDLIIGNQKNSSK